MRRIWWLLWLLLGVGLWAALASRPAGTGAISAGNGPADEELGYTATDAELIETGADGAPMYRLQAERIAQAHPDAEVTLTQPRLSYDDRASGNWSLRAERGTLSRDRQSVAFNGNVEGQRTQQRSAPLNLHTESLAVILQSHVADANAPVSLDWGRARIDAGALHADMVSGTFQLTGQGHGRLQN
jgi:LPS export ABC transporter protein LptC